MPASLNSGDWIGSYQVESRLRSGGMATLFLARRNGAAGFSRRAAIKVIHPHLSQDERFVRMFVDEARISSRISHPNVVHVEEFGEEGGLFFLVMEYVEGCSASQLLSMLNKTGSQLPIEVAVYIAIKVAEGLHSAHETLGDDGDLLGVVHRDVSPSNVLLSREGHIKLIDFGIAKARGRMAGTEAGSDLKGKIRYMSPEQACGKPVDRRSDVYALGVVLWELLCAERAFDADNEFALLEKVREPQLGGIREQRADVPEVLEQIIARVTAKDPSERPTNSYDLSRELARAVPQALLVDPADFATLIDRVPNQPVGQRAALSEDELSWVSAPVGSRPQPNMGSGRLFDSESSSNSGASKLAAGSAQGIGNTATGSRRRPPTAVDAFDPNLFGEPTPLPMPSPFLQESGDPRSDSQGGDAPLTFGTGQTGRSEPVERLLPEQPPRQRRQSSLSMPSLATNGRPPSWFERNRIVILGGALLGSGLILGLVFGSGLVGGSSSPASDAPAIPSAAKLVPDSAVEPSRALVETDTADTADTTDTNTTNTNTTADSNNTEEADAVGASNTKLLTGSNPTDDVQAGSTDSAEIDGQRSAGKRSRFRPRGKNGQSNKTKNGQNSKATDEPVEDEPVIRKPARTKVDGVLLAEELDDDVPNRKRNKKRESGKGTTAGGAPLATGFDD